MAALKREYGGIQPYIPAGIFRIRLPFLHFKISPPEIVTGLMNACTSYGALAVLTGTLGLAPEIAWGLVIFETCMYTCNWLLGEPSICGWITPAMALVIVYLEGYYDPGLPDALQAVTGSSAVTGADLQALLASGNDQYIQIAQNTTTMRMQAMAATELELGILFVVLGFSGLAKNLNTLVPPAVKAGIVLGAGIGAVNARLKTGGAMDTATWGCMAGLIVVFLLMFSLRIRSRMDNSRGLQILGNYSFLWAVLVMFIVGGIAGEFDFSNILDEGILKAPDWGAMVQVTSPFCIGWGTADMWLNGIPMALISWVIAYGDFITVQQLGLQVVRDDEYIEFDPNRTNVICGIRNIILALVAGYPAQAGPLSAPYCVATYQRYKQGGRQGMDSIYDGSGTNLIFTALGLFIYPLYMAAAAAAGPMLVVVLCIQGYVCTQICFDLAYDKCDQGVAGMMAGFILARGGGIGLIAGIALYLLLADNAKIKSDYAGNKERQRIEDEEIDKQLKALAERREAFKQGKISADEGGGDTKEF
jgi:hypothetical protein